jgi:AcrR family transcriptional regulator
MPKISDERRAARREQILNAAWTCFQREGLQAATMEDIIRASGLSAGAVYGYFASKDDLILAAVTTSLSGIGALLEPILQKRPTPPPDKLVAEITGVIAGFTARDGFDLKRIALLGWSEAQRNERLRDTMRTFYLGFRSQLAKAARDWKRDGLIKRTADPSRVATVLLSLILGFVVQSAIIGDVDPASIGEGLKEYGELRG